MSHLSFCGARYSPWTLWLHCLFMVPGTIGGHFGHNCPFMVPGTIKWHHQTAASKNSPRQEAVFMTQILLSACQLGRLLFFFSGHADQQVNQRCINQRDKEFKDILRSDHRKERPCRHGAVKGDQNEHRCIDQLA